MRVSSIVLTIFVCAVSINCAKNGMRNRLKRSLEDSKKHRTNEELGFSKDNVEEKFPSERFIKSEANDIEKRSHITDSIRHFTDESEGALIVIDADKQDDESINKKSRVSSQQKNSDKSPGISIVLNNNGMNENEEKKDEIYKEMQDGYNNMEERFGSFITTPAKHKRVRVILITPVQDIQAGNERDRLPQPDNLDQLAELDKNSLVLSENDGADNVKFLSDTPRKSELEIDIDKLKHVKEKLKLLNEDDDNVFEAKPTLVFRNLTNINTTDIETKNLSASEKPVAVSKTEHEVKPLHSYNGGEHQETPIIIHTNLTTLHERLRLHDNDDDDKKHDDFMQEQKEKVSVKKNDTSTNHDVNFESQNSTNVTNPANKIADDTEDDNNRKHEISKYGKKIHTGKDDSKSNPFDKFIIDVRENAHEGKLKPPGNPSPEDSQDLMTQQKGAVYESPTKSSSIRHKEQEELSKKEKTVKTKNKGLSEVVSVLASGASEGETGKIKAASAYHPSKETDDEKIVQQFSKRNETKSNKTNEEKKKNEKKVDEIKSKAKTPEPSKPVKSAEVKTVEKIPAAKIIDRRKAEAIIEFMNKDPLESWRYHFNTLKSLDLNSSILRSGLVNAGNIERLKGVMRRALEGKDITLSIVGGSISAGGGLYKDRGNIDGLYYKGVVDWWNKMISPLTGSDMVVNNIAIGSIGTDYFSYCVKNHIANESDIVLWELSANDYNRYKMQPTKGARPLERLTRMILELPNKPALLYVNFFKGVDYKATRESCPNFEDQGEDIIAHYYKIPSLSWRAMVCGGLVRRETGYNLDTLFSQDQYHPSLRGHAQMSLLLLLHLRHVMRAVLQWAITHEGYIDRFENQFVMPEPLFMGPEYPEPLCWTLITSDLSERITNSLQVRVVRDNGFKLEYATNFPIRFDKVICWKAEVPSADLSLQFYIPETYGQSNVRRKRSEIAITTHTRWGGSSTIWLDDRTDKPMVIKEGRPNDPGKRTQVDTIANDVGPGTHTLNVRAHDGGFCLSAIMVDGS